MLSPKYKKGKFRDIIISVPYLDSKYNKEIYRELQYKKEYAENLNINRNIQRT